MKLRQKLTIIVKRKAFEKYSIDIFLCDDVYKRNSAAQVTLMLLKVQVSVPTCPSQAVSRALSLP